MTYTLFKHPVQPDTLALVRFLASIGIRLLPIMCIERNHPPWAIANLPCIEDSSGRRYVGYTECVLFMEKVSGVQDLHEKAQLFVLANPTYRATDHI